MRATPRGLGLHAAVRRPTGRRHVEPARPCAAQGGEPGGPGIGHVRGGTCGGRGADAGGTQQSQSGTGPGLGGAQRTLRALGLVLEEVERWQRWLEQQHTLAAQTPPLQEVMETITQLIMQDTEPDPGGGPGGRRIKQHVAPDRRISIEDQDMRHGRKAVPKPSTVLKSTLPWLWIAPSPGRWWSARRMSRSMVSRAGGRGWREAPGLLQLDIDLRYMASPRIAQWAEQGVYIIARPWPQVGPLLRSMISPWTLRVCR